MADEKPEYSAMAKRKIATLIRQDDFSGVVTIDDSNTTLEFTNLKVCCVDVFGGVTWP